MIDQNFSSDLYNAYMQFGQFKKLHFKNLIHLYMDNTNQQIRFSLFDTFLSSLQTIAEKYIEIVGIGGGLLSESYPIRIEKPVYGMEQPSFVNYLIPGVTLT